MISHHQSIDNSLLNYRKKSARLDKKGRVMAKKRMPILYGIIDILRAIFVKYQYFSMRPGVFDNCHRITDSLQCLALNPSKF